MRGRPEQRKFNPACRGGGGSGAAGQGQAPADLVLFSQHFRHPSIKRQFHMKFKFSTRWGPEYIICTNTGRACLHRGLLVAFFAACWPRRAAEAMRGPCALDARSNRARTQWNSCGRVPGRREAAGATWAAEALQPSLSRRTSIRGALWCLWRLQVEPSKSQVARKCSGLVGYFRNRRKWVSSSRSSATLWRRRRRRRQRRGSSLPGSGQRPIAFAEIIGASAPAVALPPAACALNTKLWQLRAAQVCRAPQHGLCGLCPVTGNRCMRAAGQPAARHGSTAAAAAVQPVGARRRPRCVGGRRLPPAGSFTNAERNVRRPPAHGASHPAPICAARR